MFIYTRNILHTNTCAYTQHRCTAGLWRLSRKAKFYLKACIRKSERSSGMKGLALALFLSKSLFFIIKKKQYLKSERSSALHQRQRRMCARPKRRLFAAALSARWTVSRRRRFARQAHPSAHAFAAAG